MDSTTQELIDRLREEMVGMTAYELGEIYAAITDGYCLTVCYMKKPCNCDIVWE